MLAAGLDTSRRNNLMSNRGTSFRKSWNRCAMVSIILQNVQVQPDHKQGIGRGNTAASLKRMGHSLGGLKLMYLYRQ